MSCPSLRPPHEEPLGATSSLRAVPPGQLSSHRPEFFRIRCHIGGGVYPQTTNIRHKTHGFRLQYQYISQTAWCWLCANMSSSRIWLDWYPPAIDARFCRFLWRVSLPCCACPSAPVGLIWCKPSAPASISAKFRAGVCRARARAVCRARTAARGSCASSRSRYASAPVVTCVSFAPVVSLGVLSPDRRFGLVWPVLALVVHFLDITSSAVRQTSGHHKELVGFRVDLLLLRLPLEHCAATA